MKNVKESKDEETEPWEEDPLGWKLVEDLETGVVWDRGCPKCHWRLDDCVCPPN